MNNTFFLEQIFKTGNLDSYFILRQYKLDSMARFREMKSVTPKLRQHQFAKEIGWPSFTLQRYRQDIYMLSPYRIPSSSNKSRQKTLSDLKRKSNYLKRTQYRS